MNDKPAQQPLETIDLSEAQRRARRKRNIAIGLCLFAMVAIFYAATIAKFGPRVADRPIIAWPKD